MSCFPELRDSVQVLVAKFVCRDKDLELDQDFINNFNTEVQFVQGGLQSILTFLYRQFSIKSEEICIPASFDLDRWVDDGGK